MNFVKSILIKFSDFLGRHLINTKMKHVSLLQAIVFQIYRHEKTAASTNLFLLKAYSSYTMIKCRPVYSSIYLVRCLCGSRNSRLFELQIDQSRRFQVVYLNSLFPSTLIAWHFATTSGKLLIQTSYSGNPLLRVEEMEIY